MVGAACSRSLYYGFFLQPEGGSMSCVYSTQSTPSAISRKFRQSPKRNSYLENHIPLRRRWSQLSLCILVVSSSLSISRAANDHRLWLRMLHLKGPWLQVLPENKHCFFHAWSSVSLGMLYPCRANKKLGRVYIACAELCSD